MKNIKNNTLAVKICAVKFCVMDSFLSEYSFICMHLCERMHFN